MRSNNVPSIAIPPFKCSAKEYLPQGSLKRAYHGVILNVNEDFPKDETIVPGVTEKYENSNSS
jgi:hypothetical protein